MNEDRLQAFEKMLSAILAQYDADTAKLAALKAEGKEKTATYRQLFAKKMQYTGTTVQNLVPSIYIVHQVVTK